MSEPSSSGQPPLQLAEEILRAIYGDDLRGCPVSLDHIAAIIAKGMSQSGPPIELVALYERVVEAVHLLSEPPPAENIPDPNELQLLLSKRLDSIRTITTKTIDTAGRFKAQSEENGP